VVKVNIVERLRAAFEKKSWRRDVDVLQDLQRNAGCNVAVSIPFANDDHVRGGRRSDTRFGSRMVGQGARWAAVEQLFSTHCDRLGLERHAGEASAQPPPPSQPPPPPGARQRPLLF